MGRSDIYSTDKYIHTIMRLQFTLITLSLIKLALAEKDPLLYCDACRGIIAEYRRAVKELGTKSKVPIVEGQGRIRSDGTIQTKKTLIPKYIDRDWLEEVFEEGRVCYHVSSDYVKWFDGVDHKQWRIGRIMTYEGKMNPEIDLGYMRDFSV